MRYNVIVYEMKQYFCYETQYHGDMTKNYNCKITQYCCEITEERVRGRNGAGGDKLI